MAKIKSDLNSLVSIIKIEPEQFSKRLLGSRWALLWSSERRLPVVYLQNLL